MAFATFGPWRRSSGPSAEERARQQNALFQLQKEIVTSPVEPAKISAEPIPVVETQPVVAPTQAITPKVQEAGILSEKIFGVPIFYLAIGIGFLFLFKRE